MTVVSVLVGADAPVLTLTLYELITRLALPVKGSVPDWIDWRYCEAETPWFAMR